MNQRIADIDIHEAVFKVIDAIPSHREAPKSVEQISTLVAHELGLSAEVALGMTIATSSFLDLFGILEWSGTGIKAKEQIPDYFRRSLSWYFKNHQNLLSNWERSGVSRDIKVSELPERAPYFLKVLEERRLEICRKQSSIEPEFSRCQPVSVILVKGMKEGKAYFLHQWDSRAEQYQIIGGRRRLEESPLETAKRELLEEISQHDLVYGRDFKLDLLNITPVRVLEVSQTYGALTAYEFWIYNAKINLEELRLSPIDKWISLDEMAKGRTKSGKRIRDPQLHRLFDANIPNGYAGIESSMNISRTGSFLSFVEVKPSLFDIVSIDLKAMVLHFFNRRG